MRIFLLFIGWGSVLGSIGDGALGAYAMWLIASVDSVDRSISLDAFIKDYVHFLYWVKQAAFYVMPDRFVSWLFSLPALVYFPCRLLISIVIGFWALKKAKELQSRL